ncbi:hypothetical protein RchiOBHm_Chr2g0166411 [Rosa chinensis]|uniref:Uncharacterized protein n=1 Tax=Rosa chinensis TaxID=74649 RepID=A0A2P6S430_ROSCH|nr:hypothetical protein RchiOBHm_Chr2g0166411 [Rosa chinensis]
MLGRKDGSSLKVVQALKVGELSSGRGLNSEIEIKRSANTRWSSYYGTLINFIAMFSPIIDVLDGIAFEKLKPFLYKANHFCVLYALIANTRDVF